MASRHLREGMILEFQTLACRSKILPASAARGGYEHTGERLSGGGFLGMDKKIFTAVIHTERGTS